MKSNKVIVSIITSILLLLLIGVRDANAGNYTVYGETHTDSSAMIFLRSHPVLFGSIFIFSLFYVMRMYVLSAFINQWNERLKEYVDYYEYKECLSEEQVARLLSYEITPTFSDYIDVRKWDVHHFIRDMRFINSVDNHYLRITDPSESSSSIYNPVK